MSTSGWHRKQTTPAVKARAAKYANAKHQRIKNERFAQATPATPCGYCGQPLGPRTRPGRTGKSIGLWATPHAPNGIDYLPGVWHADCNRREAAPRGARTTNAQRQQRTFQRPTR